MLLWMTSFMKTSSNWISCFFASIWKIHSILNHNLYLSNWIVWAVEGKRGRIIVFLNEWTKFFEFKNINSYFYFPCLNIQGERNAFTREKKFKAEKFYSLHWLLKALLFPSQWVLRNKNLIYKLSFTEDK